MKLRTKKLTVLLVLLLIATALPVLATELAVENQAPVAEDLELSTFRGVPVEGTLLAVDPEGDLLDFQIIRAPRKGDITLDSQSGQFTFHPREGQRGRDLFTYVAVDSHGNISKEATVRLRIERQNTNVIYSDMLGHPAHFAAVDLAERGLFVGSQIGGRFVFEPETAVTRGEFLAMAMNLADTELLNGIVRTGFVDDHEIEYWLKPYVSTAVLDGVILGTPREDGLSFAPNDGITKNEAAVILNNVLGLYDTPVSVALLDLSSPSWAHQAMVNLSTRGIISFPHPDVNSQMLNRGQVAQMLVAAAGALENVPASGASLLGWAA